MDDRKNAKDLQHERQIAVSGHLVKGNISPSASKARCERRGARCKVRGAKSLRLIELHPSGAAIQPPSHVTRSTKGDKDRYYHSAGIPSFLSRLEVR